MSDVSGGPEWFQVTATGKWYPPELRPSHEHKEGWWRGTDNRWYAPELHPNYTAPPTQTTTVPESTEASATEPRDVAVAPTPTRPPVPTAPAPPIAQPPPAPRAEPRIAQKVAMTTWEGFWYVLQCIALGAGYFAKIPAKRAMRDYGLCQPTAAENFWYVLMCIFFGAGYFAKIPIAKALAELPHFQAQAQERAGGFAQPPT